MIEIKETLSFDATTTELTKLITTNGFIKRIFYSTPDFTNAVTTTITVLDRDGNEIYASAALNENTSAHIDSLDIPVDEGYSLKATLSGAAGAGGGDVSLKLFADER
jgi:hypothetical protein